MKQIRNAFWYAKRPAYWAHFWQLILKRFQTDLDTKVLKAQATAWAREQAQPIPQVLFRLGLIDSHDTVMPALDAATLDEAGKRASLSGYKMGGGGDINLLYAAMLLSHSRLAVETGVAYGWSSLAILAALQRVEDGKLVSVDMPYPGAGNEPYVGIVIPEPLRRRWTLIREPDRNGLIKALRKFPGGIDFAHYDSDKSYRGRMFGYALLWKALRPGGVFVSDDIQDNAAFAEFIDRRGLTFGITESAGKYVGIAVKPPLVRTQAQAREEKLPSLEHSASQDTRTFARSASR